MKTNGASASRTRRFAPSQNQHHEGVSMMPFAVKTSRNSNHLYLNVEDLFYYRVNAPGRKKLIADLDRLRLRYAPVLTIEVAVNERFMLSLIFEHPVPASSADITRCFNSFEPVVKRFMEEVRKVLEASPRKVA